MRKPYTSVQTTVAMLVRRAREAGRPILPAIPASLALRTIGEELVRKFFDEDGRASMITADREISLDEAPMLRGPRHPENVEPPAKPSDENDAPAADDPVASSIARASERLAAWLKHRPPADRNLVTKRVVLKAVRDELGFPGLSEKLFQFHSGPAPAALRDFPCRASPDGGRKAIGSAIK
jgi:hypothetical protein